MNGYAGKVAYIDLSTKTVTDYLISDDYGRKFLGCKILSAKILDDLLDKKIDAFDKENPFVIMTSPLPNSMSPCSSRFNI